MSDVDAAVSKKGGKIALIVGGLSSEREVSLATGRSFARALDQLGRAYEVIEAKEDLPKVLFEMKPSLALLALHGKLAEDGTVQGICEYLKIPYTGSGVLSSALAMNKIMTKQIFGHHDLPTPRYQWFERGQASKVKNSLPSLPLPLVIKPARDGSSMGLSLCREASELEAAMELAFRYDRWVLAEEYIAGTEVTVPVFFGQALSSIEIVPREGFYDYQNKYTAGKTDYFLPARLETPLLEELGRLALRACEVLDVRSYARADFRVDEQQRPYLLEVNTLPGCTETSLVPKAAAKEGIAFDQFIARVVDAARLDYEDVL